MIEKIGNIIISNFLYYHLIGEDEIEIYKFGVECYVLKLVHYITYCFVAWVCGCFYEFLIFIVSYIMLRKYAGGIHANTRTGCFVISSFLLLGILIVGQKIENNMILSILSIIGSGVIFLFAPVDNPNRILSKKEREKCRRYAIFICLFELLISLVGYEIEYLKWMQLGIIIGAFLTICGKIKYSSLCKYDNTY